MLDASIGVIVFPGSGISANLADKAKKLGIPDENSARAARERCHLSAQPEKRRPVNADLRIYDFVDVRQSGFPVTAIPHPTRVVF